MPNIRPYRGKRIDNGEWVYGWLHKLDHCDHHGKVFIIPSYASALYSYEVDPETVGQYTGLNAHRKDKEIYLGDRVKGLKRGTDDEWHHLEVHEHKGLLMFGNWNAHEFFNKFQYIEVIGNRWDNPELLEGIS